MSEAKIEHASAVWEAGAERQVKLEMTVVGIGDAAAWLDAAALGCEVRLEGFIAPRSRSSRQLVLHVNRIEFVEGIENA